MAHSLLEEDVTDEEMAALPQKLTISGIRRYLEFVSVPPYRYR